MLLHGTVDLNLEGEGTLKGKFGEADSYQRQSEMLRKCNYVKFLDTVSSVFMSEGGCKIQSWSVKLCKTRGKHT